MTQELKDYDIMDIEAMDDERLEMSSTGRIFVTRVYIKDEVDTMLAEKDAEIRRLNNALDKERSETIKYMDELCNAKNEIERLTIDRRNDELRADVADATVEKLKAEIAERKEKYNELAKLHDKAIQACCDADKVIAHHKYKRCVTMAKRCFTKSNYHFVLARHGEDAKKNNRKHVLYSKWRKRWRALAEKFKEAK